MLTLGSLCDGIGCWQRAAKLTSITPVWSAEIDTFCCNVTRRHFPDTLQLGDITQLDSVPYADIIAAGTPCQSLSIAGKREGLNGASGLFFKAIELVRRASPRFFIWENVPGALSSSGGRDFQIVLEQITRQPIPLPKRWLNAGLVNFDRGQLAWRTLDAQYFGVPQRRRRIFLVADFTDRRAAQILFEPARLSGNFAPSSSPQRHTPAANDRRADSAIGIGRDAFNQGQNAAFKPTFDTELQPTLTNRGAAAVATNVIRRLTPVECERLMGLPDDWTHGGSDSARYKALGNAMVVQCATFILNRLQRSGDGAVVF